MAESSFELQGTFAYSAPTCISSGLLAVGEHVLLVREPLNPHDANAIMVYPSRPEGGKLGYVPRSIARTLAPAIDQRVNVSASIIGLGWHYQNAKRCPRIEIKLSYTDSDLVTNLAVPANEKVEPLPSAYYKNGRELKLPEHLQKVVNRCFRKRGVYAIKNNANGRCYVGSSTNIGLRLRNHFTLLVGNSHENKGLQTDWNSFGESAFSCRVIKFLAEATTLQLEAEEAIQVHRLKAHLEGYNRTRDGSYSGGQATFEERMRHLTHSFRARSRASKSSETEPPLPEKSLQESTRNVANRDSDELAEREAVYPSRRRRQDSFCWRCLTRLRVGYTAVGLSRCAPLTPLSEFVSHDFPPLTRVAGGGGLVG